MKDSDTLSGYCMILPMKSYIQSVRTLALKTLLMETLRYGDEDNSLAERLSVIRFLFDF